MTKITIELMDNRKINIELYPNIAPISCKNFIKLCDEKFFDGLCFHRCIKGFMIQGGGFVQDGKGLVEKKAKDQIKGEFNSNGVRNDLKHQLGVISMARTYIPNSATSQFFLCAADCAFLDGDYAGFGKTTDEESNQVIIDISKVATHSYSYFDDIPNEPVVIKTVTVTERD